MRVVLSKIHKTDRNLRALARTVYIYKYIYIHGKMRITKLTTPPAHSENAVENRWHFTRKFPRCSLVLEASSKKNKKTILLHGILKDQTRANFLKRVYRFICKLQYKNQFFDIIITNEKHRGANLLEFLKKNGMSKKKKNSLKINISPHSNSIKNCHCVFVGEFRRFHRALQAFSHLYPMSMVAIRMLPCNFFHV